MLLSDNAELRELLSFLYPDLVIDDVAATSGQRVVYFCHFNDTDDDSNERHTWGDVVLKISEGSSAQAIAYFQREIEILNNLSHPGYPRLIFNEVINEDPRTEEKFRYKLFITVEERIVSQPLSEVMDQYVTEEAVIDLLHKIVTVLRPLWEWDPPLIHRDLKPENILITPDNDVVIIDLGIVREEGSAGVTLSAASFGPCTPRYASPEQANNDKRNISFKSDLFSLGTLCYELLADENPFDDGNTLLDEILVNVLTVDPMPLDVKCGCSASMSELIKKMMQKFPYKRHRKIDDVLSDIDEIREK